MPESLLERTAAEVQGDIDLRVQVALALFGHSPDGIVVVDSDGVILMVNHRAELITRYARQDLVGQPVGVLVPEALQDLHRAHRAGYMSDPRTRTMHERPGLMLRRWDGTEVPVLINLSPVPIPGRGLFVIATIRA